jgi:transglutaminase-like putative cysteine protease
LNAPLQIAVPAHPLTSPPPALRAERLLQVCLAALTSLGTLLLGMGERNVILPVLAIIVAVSSVYLTDIKGWLQLNTFVANVAGIIAGAVTVRDWNAYAAEGHLLSLANLLIYLQFVLLYRKKSVRNYWFLLLLSLLQVAVAAALNMSVSFGVLLPAYMFVGLVSLALFVVYREQAEREFAYAGPAPGKASRRWPLALRRSFFQGRQAAGGADRGLGWGFLRQMIWLGAATLVLAVTWFVGLPRPGKKGPWRPTGVVPYTSVGFSESVTLGQLGEVYENPEEVMRVSFVDQATGDPYRIGGDAVLFRGSVLYRYDSGHWHPLSNFGPRRVSDFPVVSEQHFASNQHPVREEITIQARQDNVLFTALPAYAVEGTGLLYSKTSEQLLRPGHQHADERFKYSLITTAFRDHIPDSWAPADGVPPDAALETPTRHEVDSVPGLKAIAADVAGALVKPELVARTLESYLRDSPEFQYSLKPLRRTAGVDPVEDFVTVHKSGHCEYFASALTLMLRSLKIPARLAIGFKGGEYNPGGRYYQVRELHAHAWVEAYVPPEFLPPSLANNEQARTNGAWLALDPTPHRNDEDEFADSFGLGAAKRLLDLTQLVWTNYVLGMDSQRQQEAIYQPLVQRFEDALSSLTEEEGRERIRQWLTDTVGRRMGLSRGLFSRQGLLASLVGLLMLIGSWKLTLWAARRLWRRLARRPAGGRRAVRHVDFYDRFEALLGRYGMPRTPNQTQREFALATSGHLAESPLTQQVGLLPRRIAEAYYRVRFGQRKLSGEEMRSIEEALGELAAALAARQAASPRLTGGKARLREQ